MAEALCVAHASAFCHLNSTTSMNKFLLPAKCVLALAFVSMLLVSCGLKITSIVFSTHEPEQGAVLTVTSTLEPTDHNNQAEYYLLYAVRVPEDWSGEDLAVTLESGSPEMMECAPYAQLCQFCYPREGYKWIGYQSVSKTQQGNRITAAVDLKVGEPMGSCTLDIMGGGWKKDPAELVNANGEVNLELAFGNNLDFTEPCTNKDDATGTPATLFHTSEYLFNASTISKAENEARRSALSAAHTLTLYGLTLPIATEIANIAEGFDMSVNVKEGAGIEGVNADANKGATEYFDLQGRSVANPEAGLYLVKRGGKVAKEIVK